jgi:hypothetical protein
MTNGYKRVKIVLNHDKRSGMVRNGEGRSEMVRDGGDGKGLWCHDGGRSVNMGHDGLKMVTGR